MIHSSLRIGILAYISGSPVPVRLNDLPAPCGHTLSDVKDCVRYMVEDQYIVIEPAKEGDPVALRIAERGKVLMAAFQATPAPIQTWRMP